VVQAVFSAPLPLPLDYLRLLIVINFSCLSCTTVAIPINSTGAAWMNWSMVLTPFCFAIFLAFFRDEYIRLHMDLKAVPDEKTLAEIVNS
jgi:hypothetical protein